MHKSEAKILQQIWNKRKERSRETIKNWKTLMKVKEIGLHSAVMMKIFVADEGRKAKTCPFTFQE